LRQWLNTRRIEAIASLNQDEHFWWNLHHTNQMLREQKQSTNKMPNLGYLSKFKLGTLQKLESLLHDRVIDYIYILKAPTTHKHHWIQKAQYLRLLLKHHDQLYTFLLDTFEQIPNNPTAYEIAWDRYVTNYCHNYELTAERAYPQTYPACEAEDTCFLCALQWENSPNAIRKSIKCTCCEMKAEDILLPEISLFEPDTPNGSQDERLNQHIWSLTDSSSQLPDCLEPMT
jgi:hypothetical protein